MLTKKTGSKRICTNRKWILYTGLFAAGLLLSAYAFFSLWNNTAQDAAARNEYDTLRERFHYFIEPVAPVPHEYQPPAETDEVYDNNIDNEIAIDSEIFEEIETRLDMSYFTEINPDFVGWITIGGTPIDYPVVRGRTNSVYLRLTFRGELNPAGSIFMDYRALQAFETPVTILYGHNMRDGSMFASLHKFLDRDFLANNSELTIITACGDIFTYEIFEARLTHAWDDVYWLDFNNLSSAGNFFSNAPEGSKGFLVMSTCVDNDRDGRLIVSAALISRSE
jgi:SrtB family sortase